MEIEMLELVKKQDTLNVTSLINQAAECHRLMMYEHAKSALIRAVGMRMAFIANHWVKDGAYGEHLDVLFGLCKMYKVDPGRSFN